MGVFLSGKPVLLCKVFGDNDQSKKVYIWAKGFNETVDRRKAAELQLTNGRIKFLNRNRLAK